MREIGKSGERVVGISMKKTVKLHKEILRMLLREELRSVVGGEPCTTSREDCETL